MSMATKFKTWGLVLGTGLLTAVPAVTPASAAPVPHAGPPRVTAAAPFSWVTTRAYFNDPRAGGDGSNVTRNLVIHHFGNARTGSVVRVTTWNLSDAAISDTMIRALHRGVTIKVIVARSNCDASATQELKTAMRNHAGSFVQCSTGPTRAARTSGVMHQKSYTFPDLGSVKNVTLLGSANATVEGYADQWVDMFQFVNRADVMNAYNKVFALQQAGKNLARPYRAYSFNSGKGNAQFYPVNDPTPTAADDPVHTRITTLPKGPGTTIRVASYAMQGARGNWLATDLINQKKAGSKVVVLTGPPASDAIETRLRKARIEVTRAFDPPTCGIPPVVSSCNYIHLKLMTATYVRGGTRQYRVWTGSDNWSPQSLVSDEVSQKISGRAPYQQYVSFVDTIRRLY